jgi:CubicO group peptidase (beta-lactamase class C family)
MMDLHNIKFIPNGSDTDDYKFVCSGYSEIRNKHLFGEVNDENCFVLGGVAGHAGLFGTAKDVCALAEHVRTCVNGSATKPIISKSASIKMLEKSPVDPDWAYGWHYPTQGKSSAGQLISPNSIGMTGFTGTSVWIDFDKDLVITILTNRTASPDSARTGWEMDKFTEVRPRLHDAILGEI